MNLRFRKLLLTILVFSCCFHFNSIAQGIALCPPSTSKKATKLFEEAKAAKKAKKDYKELKEILLDAIDEDSLYAEPWLLLGDAAFGKGLSTMKKAYGN
ncbi:MAG: hypothetical protein IPP71_12055 [Bacteroidetes bacterium]|nr:hypothetical protein [Bacteroidota bacterium]